MAIIVHCAAVSLWNTKSEISCTRLSLFFSVTCRKKHNNSFCREHNYEQPYDLRFCLGHGFLPKGHGIFKGLFHLFTLIKFHRKCHTFGTNVHVLIATKRLLLVQHNIAINILTLLHHQSYNIPETAYSFCGVLAPPTTSEISHVQPRGS